MRFLLTTLFTLFCIFSTITLSAQHSLVDYIIQTYNMPYNITIEEDREVNAYTDGTRIVIFRGLLDLPEANVQSVTVIIMHEIGHIVNNHLPKRQAISVLTNIKMKSMCVSDDGSYDRLCLSGYYLEYLRYLRSQEYEADMHGYKFAKEHNFNAEKACAIYKTFAEHEKLQFDLYSTHPLGSLRYKNCIDYLSN